MKEIVIDIEADGSVKIEGKGFEGPECELFTKELEADLGTVTKKVKKPEYHRAVRVTRKA